VIGLWCKICNTETPKAECDICGVKTETEMPVEVCWCDNCKTPVIKEANAIDKNSCPLCGETTRHLGADLRPVFPEERLLIEIILGKPLEYLNKTVWVVNNRYFIDGQLKVLTSTKFEKANIPEVVEQISLYKTQNSYDMFNESIKTFISANKRRLEYLESEAFAFINSSVKKYPIENVVISFSGGKDSTVTADLVTRALSNPSIVHIFGDTTLEFPLTMEYAKRFRVDNPLTIFKTAKNKDQDFFKVCEDIGPPARMMRWCCYMFKTGPITRTLNNMYKNENILTFYGIRKCESAARSKYKRIEDDAESIKIQKQTVASPIFFWKDIDIWLYILGENIDFNDAYRLGYDRVGCWCCPNNSIRAQFLSKIYMPEQSEKWREFLIDFAKKIGKPDPEVYVDTGKWKARQGGNGVESAQDVKIKFTNCTTENNAKIYRLNKPITDEFINMFIPFGEVKNELGRKLIDEKIIVDIKTKIPIISIQPFEQDGYENAVKIATMNVKKHDDLQRMIGYQIRKYNACRKCLKCESLCKFGAITINADLYKIDSQKCKRCKMCVTAKYLEGGCMMDKFLKTK
jgi:phosphoadenosine phosphosulfate reductase